MTQPFTRIVAAIGFAAAVTLLVAAGCKSHAPSDPIVSGQTLITSNKLYAGTAACAECHRSEFDVQSHSHHALTLRHGDSKSLGRLSPPVGPIPGTAFTVSEKDGYFTLSSSDTTIEPSRIEYALGSGAANVTYIGKLGKDQLTEYRMSLDPALKRWYITPGQEANSDRGLGLVHSGPMANRCVLCHADVLQPDSPRPVEGSLGVGCESCHGPGAAHIAAVRSNPRSTDLKIVNPGKSTPHEINLMCGTCHRSISDVPLTGLDSVNTPRFQTYALEISKCFRESGNSISCITCHDPHADASKDEHHYETICLSCHTSSKNSNNKVCPVNARDKCIGCHMPKSRVMPLTKIPLQMTDHLIWAYKPVH